MYAPFTPHGTFLYRHSSPVRAPDVSYCTNSGRVHEFVGCRDHDENDPILAGNAFSAGFLAEHLQADVRHYWYGQYYTAQVSFTARRKRLGYLLGIGGTDHARPSG